MKKLCLALVFGLFACSSEGTGTESDGGANADASAGADTSTPAPPASTAPLPVPTLAEGSCQFTVDSKTHQGNAITSLVTGAPDAWSLQCQAADGTRSLTINMGGKGFKAPGTYTGGAAPAPNGIMSYSEQDSTNPGSIKMYRQDKGFTITLTAVGANLVGAASFVGALAPNPSKPVEVAFNFKFK